MNLEAMRYVAAKLLTDQAFQERFFTDAPDNHKAYDLSREEFDTLRALDRAKLGISSEGYSGKRFERVESAFPMTLRVLEALDRGARLTYLAKTAFPPNDKEERATFMQWVRAGEARPPDVQRFLDDLADFELLLYDGPRPPGLPSYRFRPEVTRPRRTAFALTLQVRGPLPETLMRPDASLPATYPEAARKLLILRDGSSVQFESLEGRGGELLAACDGTRTIRQLVETFGPQAEPAIERWLKFQVVDDAASG